MLCTLSILVRGRAVPSGESLMFEVSALLAVGGEGRYEESEPDEPCDSGIGGNWVLRVLGRRVRGMAMGDGGVGGRRKTT